MRLASLLPYTQWRTTLLAECRQHQPCWSTSSDSSRLCLPARPARDGRQIQDVCGTFAMAVVHIHAPPATHFAAVNHCPVCMRSRRMLGSHVEWYGTTWTCAGCGDKWSDGELHERPFAPGWRRQSIERARKLLASLGVQA